MGDIVLKTPVGFWTLKDVRVVPSLTKSLISVRQLDKQGHEVKFENQQWKVIKGNLGMARGRKKCLLYMVGLPSSSEDKQSSVHIISWAEEGFLYKRET